MRNTSCFVEMQISLSTAEDARNYFCGDQGPVQPTNGDCPLAPGTYRVIDGALFRLVPGLPPGLPYHRPEPRG